MACPGTEVSLPAQGYHGRKNQLSPGKVSPAGATRERDLLTVNPGTGPAIGETVLGTGVPPGGLIKEHRLRRGDDDDEVMLNVLRCQLTY